MNISGEGYGSVPGGKMLADPQFIVAERVEEDRLLGILGQISLHRASRGMQRHHEHSKTQGRSPSLHGIRAEHRIERRT